MSAKRGRVATRRVRVPDRRGVLAALEMVAHRADTRRVRRWRDPQRSASGPGRASWLLRFGNEVCRGFRHVGSLVVLEDHLEDLVRLVVAVHARVADAQLVERLARRDRGPGTRSAARDSDPPPTGTRRGRSRSRRRPSCARRVACAARARSSRRRREYSGVREAGDQVVELGHGLLGRGLVAARVLALVVVADRGLVHRVGHARVVRVELREVAVVGERLVVALAMEVRVGDLELASTAWSL